MLLVNPSGRIVDVDEEFYQKRLSEGYTKPSFSDRYDHIDIRHKRVLIFRKSGGLGDIICMLPSVVEASKIAASITVAVPDAYSFVFSSQGILTVPLTDVLNRILDFDNLFDEIVNMYCPCGVHETQTNYKPYYGRVKNFADALHVPVTPPVLNNFESNHKIDEKVTKLKVLLQLNTNNPSKSTPIFFSAQIAEALKQLDFFVATVDFSYKINGVPSITGKELHEIPGYVLNFDLVIGADSGIMHIASALGIPTLWLFGPTSAKITTDIYKNSYAIQGKSNLDCQGPCYYSKSNGYQCASKSGACMSAISVDNVIKVVNLIFS